MHERQTVTPQFRITDARRSAAFYVDGLGFALDWEHRFEPGFPVFMQVTRAGQTIFLTEHAGDCRVGGAAYFVVPDVDACYREFKARGVAPEEPPADMPWGPREMVVADPDGNRLRFASRRAPADDSPSGGLRHVRHGFSSVRPYVHGPTNLWDLAREAFGAVEVERHEFGPRSFHIEARIGDSIVVLETGDPPHPSGTPGSIYLYVPDVDAAYRRALELGATPVEAPQDKPYQERSAGVRDSFGNIWFISTYRGSPGEPDTRR
jgi:uncharacterized glyoxalase superfamily protein PhnB